MKGSMPKPGGVRTGIEALPLLLGQPAALLDACSCAEMAQVRQESSRSICYFSLFDQLCSAHVNTRSQQMSSAGWAKLDCRVLTAFEASPQAKHTAAGHVYGPYRMQGASTCSCSVTSADRTKLSNSPVRGFHVDPMRG